MGTFLLDVLTLGAAVYVFLFFGSYQPDDASTATYIAAGWLLGANIAYVGTRWRVYVKRVRP